MDAVKTERRGELLETLKLPPELRENAPLRPRIAKIGIAAGAGALVIVATGVVLPGGPLARSLGERSESRDVVAPSPVVSSHPVLVASGFVVARREATVSAQETGRLVERRVEVGDAVRAGQVLALLDQSLADIDLRLAAANVSALKAAVETARAEVAQADADRDRTRLLRERGFASAAAEERAGLLVTARRAQLGQRQAELENADLQSGRTARLRTRLTVTAPFDGLVTGSNAQIGEIVSPISVGGFTRTGVYTITDLDSLEIDIRVSEAQISRVAPGASVEVVFAAVPDKVWPGSVAAIVPSAERDRGTFPVRIRLIDRPTTLLPGMAAEVRFLQRDR